MRLLKVIITGVILTTIFFSISPNSTNAEVTSFPKIGEIINGNRNDIVAAFSPTDNILASSGIDAKISLWNTDNLSLITSFKSDSNISELAFNSDGTKLLVKSRERMFVIDVATSEELYSVKNVIDATFDHTGTKLFYIASLNYNNTQVVYWDLINSKEILGYPVPNNAKALDYDSKSEQLAIGFTNGEIGIRDAKTGNHLQTISGIDQYTDTHKLIYSENSGSLFSVVNLNINSSSNHKGILRIFDSSNFKLLNTITLDAISISDLAVSEDGAFYLMQIQNRNNSLNMFEQTRIYDAISNEMLATTTSRISVGNLAINPSFTKLFASGSYYDISNVKRQEIKELIIKTPSNIYAPNEIIDLKLEAVFNDGRTIVIPNEQAKWNTSNNLVTRFIAGKLQANQQGTANITAEYKGLKAIVPVKVSEFTELPTELNVATDKVWEITFSKNVNLQTIKEQNIYIIDQNNTVIPLLYYVESTSKNKVNLIPVKNYESGNIYTIVVKDVSSENNDSLQQFKIKKFTVQ